MTTSQPPENEKNSSGSDHRQGKNGKDKRQGQLLVGFALETENEVANAKSKLERKNADMIVLNSLRNPGAGFAVGTNQVTYIDRQGRIKAQELKSKEEVASDILDYLPSLS